LVEVASYLDFAALCTDSCFNGAIDDVRIYCGAPTATEIAGL